MNDLLEEMTGTRLKKYCLGISDAFLHALMYTIIAT